MAKLISGNLPGIVILFSGFLFLCQPVYAQVNPSAVERATREVDQLNREDREKLEKLKTIPEKPSKPAPSVEPIKKEEQKFYVKKVVLAGCETYTQEDFAFIISKYENKEVGLSDLNVLAKEIEREYLKKGVITAVFVPQQDVKDETVRLQVVEAKFGELQIQDHKFFKKSRLTYYWKMHHGEVLRYDKLSKSIQLMNKNPDRQVKAALHAGKTPGSTDVYLTPVTHFPAHFTSSFDREGSTSTGRSRQGYGLRYNNFLGFDDTLISGYTFGRDFFGQYAYHSLPVSSEGASVMYGYSHSASTPSKEYASQGLKSRARTSSLSLHQDIYSQGDYLGEVSLGFEANDKTTWLNTGVYNRDRLRVFSASGNYLHRGIGSALYIAPELSQGVDAFGASRRGNPLASRNAKTDFTKFGISAQYKKSLPLNLQGNIKFKAQVSSTKLFPQEQFSLGGIDSVRGYPSGDYQADNAVSNSLELLIPAFFIPSSLRIPYDNSPLQDETTVITFLDYGWGKRRSPLTTEKKFANLLSIGGGLRFNLFNQALLRIEAGFPLGANRTITETAKSRVHVSFEFQDKLPEEIERIRKMIEDERVQKWSWALLDMALRDTESALAKKVNGYLYQARKNMREGNYKEAKAAYEKLQDLGIALYRQSEDYAHGSLAQKKELQESLKLATLASKEGKFDEARQQLHKVLEEAKPRPLVFEF